MYTNKDPIHIVCSVDRNKKFQEITSVMLYSLMDNLSSQRSAYIYILHESNHISTIKHFCDQIQSQRTNVRFNFISIDEKIFEDKKVQSYNNLPLGTFYRLKIADVIDAEKALYLDGDIIVNHDISWLYDVDLEDNLVWGVKTNVLKPWMENIQVDNYINAGVLLINIKLRKKEDIWDQCIEFCSKYPKGILWKKYIMGDQCAINKVCHNRIKFLPPIYNQTPMCFGRKLDYKHLGYDKKLYQQAILDPAIIHFAGAHKPRNYNSLHPYNYKWNIYHNKLTNKTYLIKKIWDIVKYPFYINQPIFYIYQCIKKIIKKFLHK